jgi:hypothetical protein
MSQFIVTSTNIVWKNIYLGFFKFYQPKATSGGFLIFEWTLYNLFQNQKSTTCWKKKSLEKV